MRRPIVSAFVAAILLVTVLLCLTGCGGEALTLDDFNVYQDGEAVRTPDDFFAGADFLFADTDEFDPASLATARGIALGNSAEAVAKTYSGCHCTVYADGFSLEQEASYAGIANLSGVLDELAGYEEYWVYYDLWLIDGEVLYNTADVLQGSEQASFLEHDEARWYELAFIINNGTVRNIKLSLLDFVDESVNY